MADNTINIDLIINAAKSAKTLEQQREALKDLRDGLDKVKQGSGAFELLTDSVTELQKEMGLLNLTFEDAYGNIKPLTGQIGELEDRLYQMALAGQQNTDEFKQIQAETVRLKQSLRDVDDTVDALSQRGAKLRGFIQVAEGIASGFAVAQGALALFGNENEEVEKAILKVQGAMSLLQGIQALSTALTEKNALFTGLNTAATTANTTATTANTAAAVTNTAATGTATTAIAAETTATTGATIATRIWNAVLKVNPLFLMAGIIVGVVSAIYAFSKATGIATTATEGLNKALEFQQDLLQYQKDAAVQAAQSRIALAEAEGKSEKELSALKLKELNIREAADRKELANLNKQIALKKSIRKNQSGEEAQATQDTINELDKQKAALEVNLRDQEGQGNSYQIQRKIIHLNTNKAIDKSNKATSESYNKDLKNDTKNTADELEQRKAAQEDYNKTIIDLSNKSNSLLFKNRQIWEDDTLRYFNELKFQYEQDQRSFITEEEGRIKIVQDNLKNGLITQDQYAKQVSTIQKQYADIQNERLKFYWNEQEAQLRKNVKDVESAELQVNKAILDIQLETLANEEKLFKQRLQTKFTMNEDEVQSNKKSLETQLVDLEKTNATKNVIIENNEKYLAELRTQFNEAQDIETRQNLAKDIKNQTDRIEQGKFEIENNKKLILEKKEQLKYQTALYGDGAKISVKDYNDGLLTIEEAALKKRINYLTNFYVVQKSLLDKYNETAKGESNDLIKGLSKDLEDNQKLRADLIAELVKLEQEANNAITDDAKKAAAENVAIKSNQISDIEDGIKQIEVAQSVANTRQREQEVKYQKDVLDLKSATINKIEGLNLEDLVKLKEKHAKELTELEKQKDKIVDFEKAKSDLIAKQNTEFETASNVRVKTFKKESKAAEDAAQATNGWYETLSKNQQAIFEKSVDLLLQTTQMVADYITQSTEQNISQIEKVRDAEIEAFDLKQENLELQRNEATAEEIQEVIRTRSIADQRAAIEEEYNNKIREQKKRAFEAQKYASLIEIGINTAVEISKTLANPILAVLVGIAGAAQAAFVAQQPTPEFAKGGLLEGPSHAQGGIKTQFGELEGGEAVINKKSTKKYMPLLSAINQAGGGVQFASGGVLPSQTVVVDNSTDFTEIKGMLREFAAKPILTYVNESDVTRAQRNQRKIEKRTTF